MKQLIEDLISAMEYHVEQTRPVHMTTVAIQAAKDALKAMPTPVQSAERGEPVACIRSLTDQCAALVRERDELQKQVWRYEKQGVTCQTYGHKVESSCSECNVHDDYTAPPAAQKPWVDLTDEEIMAAPENLIACIAYVRNKLKEKNT